MVIFHSDIDNTLIYSYKHDIGIDKVGVEIYEGRVISFMTAKTHMLLKEVARKTIFIPTTTRTLEQFQRIDFGVTPDYALVCNGGVLLDHGKEDAEWYAESLELVKHAEAEMKKAQEYLEQDSNRSFELRYIRDLFLFTKSEKPLETVKGLKAVLDAAQVDVFHNGVKVYVVPKNMDKGTACERLKKRLQADYRMAAGDSEFDIPMLAAVEEAIAPKGLQEMYGLDVQAVCDEEKMFFSDFVLEHVLNRK